MPRPRQIDDELLLSAAGSVLAEVGPAQFTLERAAQRASVSAATYIKRFGSKKALLVEMNRRWLESIDGDLADAVATGGTPLERLRAAALWGVQDMDDAGTAGRQLVALAKDLQDDDLRAQLADGLARIRAVLETLVSQAVSAGYLPAAPPPPQAADLLSALLEGTKITWSVAPTGSLIARVGRDIDTVLRDWSR
ncbi:MAG: TetR/AcrR family transcriptional regulator [Actinomycetota bacterium]|nr:TetR/AcrR family transcriptional regulator [Actinomycetota bacterium]